MTANKPEVEVKRYAPPACSGWIAMMCEDELGEWVLAEHYEALQAELARERQRRFDGNEQASREYRADVKALVEALKACRDELLWMIERHNQQDQSDGSWLYDHQTVEEADTALAAYRKQGGDV